jgi:DNA-binding transcriptional LysR family regulator
LLNEPDYTPTPHARGSADPLASSPKSLSKVSRLIRLLPDCDRPVRPMNLLYLRDRRMLPNLRSFVDFIIEQFGAAS